MGFKNKIRNFMTTEQDEFYDDYGIVTEEEGMEPRLMSRSRPKPSNPIRKTGDEIMVREFFEYHDVMEASQALKESVPVICNMQRCKEEEIRRIVDFLSGTVFCIDGELRRIGDALFLATPYGIIVDGVYKEDENEARQQMNQLRKRMTGDDSTHDLI